MSGELDLRCFTFTNRLKGRRDPRVVIAIVIIKENIDRFLVSQHIYQMLELMVVVIECIAICFLFFRFWKIRIRIFYEPDGAGLTVCTFDNKIGLASLS